MAKVKTGHERIEQLEREVEQLQLQNEKLQATISGNTPSKRWNWRQVLASLFLLMGLSILIPASILLWLNRTITNTDRYVATVTPIITQAPVQKAIQQAANTAIFTNVDVDQVVKQALPENAQFLAAPIAGQVKSYTNTTIGTIVASPQFANIWVETNRQAQITFMNVAKNSSGSPVVDVNRVYAYISTQLTDTPLAAVANKQLPPSVGQIQIANVPALEKIPHYVALLETWRWIMAGLCVIFLALAIVVANNRRRMVMAVGLGSTLATVVVLAMVRVSRGALVAHIADPVYRAAAQSIWQTVLHPLYLQVLILVVLGLAMAVVAWLFGPSRPAVALRSTSQHGLGSARAKVWPGSSQSGFVAYLTRYHQYFQIGILVATITLLLIFAPLAIATAITILGSMAVVLLILEFLVAPAPARQETLL